MSYFALPLPPTICPQIITTRMQLQLKRHLVPGVEEGVGSMYDLLGRLVFDAAIASLFNERAGADPTLYPAFSVFDSYLPLAVAGIPVERISNAKQARAHLAKALHMYKVR